MRLLLDTNILLWALVEPGRLQPTTWDAIKKADNVVLFSAASIWEIAIKAGLGRADFPVRPEEMAREAREVGFIELPITADLAARVADLPLYHRDPSDCLLVAQAMAERAWFPTADAMLQPYSDLVTLIG